MGVAKYGTTVADNPLKLKQWLQHALEETLDQAIYLKRAVEELEASAPRVATHATYDGLPSASLQRVSQGTASVHPVELP